jgi:hypothetical protein
MCFGQQKIFFIERKYRRREVAMQPIQRVAGISPPALRLCAQRPWDSVSSKLFSTAP